MAEKKLYVLDASGYLFRSYFAIPHMTNREGKSTNALFGFIRSLLKLQKDFSPTYCIAVFDGPKSQEKRKAIFADYKAHRLAAPPDLFEQIDQAERFCQLYGLPMLSVEGVEADDTMGSVAKWAEERDWTTYLCTSDKDMAQLVNENTFLLNTHKDNLLLDAAGVEKTYGVPPNKMVDFLAIMGDSSDNIPGLSGFGPKTAADVLQKFSSLDAILAHPEKVSGKKKQETIRAERDKALLSRELVILDTAVPIPQETDFYTLKKPESQALKEFYSSMRFLSLLKEFSGESTEKREEEITETYTLVNDEKSLDTLLALLHKQKEICFDTETTHYQPIKADLVGIGVGYRPGEAWYIPMNGALDKKTILKRCQLLFENPAIGFYGHNVKYDLHVLANEGIHVKNICFDTILASYILNSHSRRHSLDILTLELFGKRKIALEELIGKGRDAQKMFDVPLEKIANYCCEDVDYTIRLRKELGVQLEKRQLMKLFTQLELPLLPILARMERKGIFLDVPALEKLGTVVRKELHKQEKKIYEMAGEEFNINSPKQMSHILFEKMGIPPPKKTATGHSTRADVLEFLQEEYPIAEEILTYRQLEKLRSTYIETLPQEVAKSDGRIHCTFVQSGTATGRLSCQDPNLQNIPIRSKLGKQIREAFRPQQEGWSYLSADYSQMELRLLAHLSEDPKLIAAFQKGADVHAHTAADLYEIPIEEVSYSQRQHAKAVNFGVIYGQQAFGLARELGIPHKAASEFIEKYFDRYKKVREFIASCKEKVRQTGKALTYTGRERAIPEIQSKNMQIRAAAERLAVNTPLQGSAADMMKQAMLNIQARIDREGGLGFMILQIHDELLFELPDFAVLDFTHLVKEEMEGVLQLKVPLVVDISVGKNWKECYS